VAPQAKREPAVPNEVALTCRLLAESLRNWGFEAPAEVEALGDAEEVCHRYFRVLAQNQFARDQLLGDLPEVAFVKRLPEEPFGQGIRFSSTAAPLHDELARLATHLGANARTMPKLDVPALVGIIRYQMNYDRWFKYESQRRYSGKADFLD